VRPGGEVRWIATSATILRDERGSPLRLLGATVDTTERKESEEELRKNEEFRRRILDSTRDCVEVLDLEGRFQSINSGGLAVAEIDDVSALIGASWIEFWGPGERTAAREAVEAAAGGGMGQFQGFLPTRKSRTPKWWDVVITPILDFENRPVQLLAVSRDVTEHKQMEAKLRAADRRKDEFLAMLAHELRNPLSAISTAAHLARHHHLSDEDRRWSQDVIQRQLKHLSRLIDDLLDVSRITLGKIELRHELLDVRSLIVQAVEAVKQVILDRGHNLEILMPQESLPVWGDATRLEQAIVNLLTNAAKYTETGGRIRLLAETAGSDVFIKIRDSGVGIQPEKIPEMFELFAQGDRSLARSEGGLGIGLTLVKQLIEMHGGCITAHSEGPGTGSEFVIRLPLAPRHRARATGAEDASASSTCHSRVLVVDDNDDAAKGLARLLSMKGYEVQVAHDGPSAIALARLHIPDIILLDLGMPGMDGYQVATELRRAGCFKETVLIALTGYGDEDHFRRSRAAGFRHHLVKPVDFDQLTSLLSRTE
jgi:PAS domain S-box-containing protein